MERFASRAHPSAMAKQLVTPRFKQRRRLYLREWRKHRGYTLEQLGEMVGMTPGNLSHLERGLIPYNQDFLEAAAEALQTDPASLMMRDPTQPDAIWSVWEKASAGQREQIIEVAKALIRTGT